LVIAYNEKLHDELLSPSAVRIRKSIRLQYAGSVSRLEETKNAYIILVWKSPIKFPRGQLRKK
jgi:hypothetical protein